jgi:hypothetical protein
MRKRLPPAILILPLLALLLLASCTANQRSRVQSYLLTRAASGLQTSAVDLPTLIVSQGKTRVPAGLTRVATQLTPVRPATGYRIHPQDTILFNVDKTINVREAAYRFSTLPDYLIQWNRDRYPTLTDSESRLSPGWVIVIFQGTSGRPDLIPSDPAAWQAAFGCGGSPPPGEVNCQQAGLDYVSEKGRNLQCLPDTLAGEYTLHTSLQGFSLYRSGEPFVYGVYWDAASNTILQGPAVITRKNDVTQCG